MNGLPNLLPPPIKEKITKADSIYIDLDGVLANFTKSACKHFNVPYLVGHGNQLHYNWLYLEYGIEKEKVDSLCSNRDYWLGIEPFFYSFYLIETCAKNANEVFILSKPMDHSTCYAAKVDWCKEVFQFPIKQTIITEVPKYKFVKSKKDILIDDRKEQIIKWNDAGGTGFWWPELVESEKIMLFAEERIDILLSIIRNL